MAKKPIPSKITKPQAKPPVKTKPAADGKPGSSGLMPYIFAVLAITALCYLPSLRNQLVNWDDDPNITENPNLERIGNGATWGETITNIFDIDKGAVIGNYNPLPILTFGIEKSLAGDFNPTLIHFTNLLLHLLTVLFAMRLLSGMGLGNWGVFTGGLLFGIHPMRVESVAWATERKDVLFAVFFFAALVYYVKWIKAENEGKRPMGIYLIMLLFAVLSMFSKVQAVTLVLSMVALDYWFRRKLSLQWFLEKVPFGLLGLVFGLVNLYTLKQQGSTEDDLTNFTLLDRLCIGTYSFCTYLYKLVLPWPMSPLYPYPKPLPIWVYLAPIPFFAIWYGVYRAWKQDRRIIVFGVLFFFFNVMFLLQVLGAGQGFLADRFTYVPYFGFFAIAAALYEQYSTNAKMKGNLQIGLGIVGIVCAIWTVIQIGVWKNGETLWTHVIKYEGKTNSLPYWNRAQYFRAQKNFDLALKDYTEAINIEPQKAELYNSRGKTYFDMATSGNFEAKANEYAQKALTDYTTGLGKPAPKDEVRAELLINRGAAYGASGNIPQSIQDISEGLRLNPKNKNGYFNRSIAYFNAKQYDLALADYTEYLKYDPYNANILYESGMLNRSLNKNQEAIDNLSKAIQIKPDLGLAWLERARAYVQVGNKAEAIKDYQRARQLGVKLDQKDMETMSGK